MKIPRTIRKKKNTFVFVKKCNDNIFQYKEEKLGYIECFTRYDLKMIKETKRTTPQV